MTFSLFEFKIVAKEVDYMNEKNILDKLLEEQNGYTYRPWLLLLNGRSLFLVLKSSIEYNCR